MSIMEETKRGGGSFPPLHRDQASLESSSGPLADNIGGSILHTNKNFNTNQSKGTSLGKNSSDNKDKDHDWARNDRDYLDHIESEVIEDQEIK